MDDGVRLVWAGAMTLGEGPVWDTGDQALWFVDIKQHRVHRHDPGAGAVASWAAPSQVGWVLPDTGGLLVAGLQTGLARFDPADGSFTAITAVEPDEPGNRLNDAAVAPDGAIWFGSMDDGHERASGRVYRFDGRTVGPTAIPPVPITNGPAIAPGGRSLYHVDTVGGTVYRVPIATDGTTGEPVPFVRIDPADGFPDGASVDAAGNVWLGVWGGSEARLYAADGRLIRRVRLPAANVTKVALGGPDLTTAYVTTARAGLGEAALADQPDAGGLFAFEVETPGLSQPLARISPP